MTERSQPVWRAFGTDRDLGAKLVIVHSPRSCSPRSTNLQRGIFPQQLWLSSPDAMGGYGGHLRKCNASVNGSLSIARGSARHSLL
jgi:hypothetical protein